MKIKTQLLALLLGSSCLVVAQELILTARPFGIGEQHSYNIDQWDGNETVITKLNKDKTIYEFVRTSKDMFEIRTQAPVSEVVFRFEMTFGIDRDDAKLVDVFSEKDKVTALLYSSAGYNLMFASKTNPILEKGKYMFYNRSHALPKWYWCGATRAYHFFNEMDIAMMPASKVASIKLVGTEKVEVRSRNLKGEVGSPEVFLFAGSKIVSNGVEVDSVARIGVSDEETLVEIYNSLSDEELRAKVLRFADSKEEFLQIILENNRDKKNYDAIKARLDKAFASADQLEKTK